MYTLIKSFVRKYSTVALHTECPFPGFKYDDIDTSKNYPLRSLLTEILGNRIDDGFHMAYEQFIQALNEKDHHFLSCICTPNLQRQLEKHTIQIHNLNNDTKDIIYTDLTVIIGDRTQQCIKLSLLDCINLDIYGSESERTPIEGVCFRVECYVLSQLVLQPDQQFDSIYHRLLFESRLTQACQKNPNFIEYILCSPKKKIKYLRNHFMGKQFEWRILEIDNL